MTSEIDLARVSVVPFWPDRSMRGNHDPVPEDIRGATIVRVGGPENSDVDNRALVIDYLPSVSTALKRLVLAFDERGIWVEFHGNCEFIGEPIQDDAQG